MTPRLRPFPALGAAAALGLFAWACGNGSVNKNSGTGTSGGGSSGSTGGGSSSGGSTGGSNGVAVNYAGQIEAVQSLSPGVDGGPSAQSYTLTADFYPNIGGGGAGCSGSSVLGCCYAPSAGGGGANPVGAGTLTLVDGQQSWPLPFDPTNGYGVLSAATWNPGVQLEVQAAGDPNGVAAFQVTAAAPVALAGLSPNLTTGSVSISVNQDWTLAWAPGSPAAQSMVVSLGPVPGATTATPMGSITCTPNDGDGTVTFSAALLANFQAGQTAQVSIARVNSATATPSNASVIFQTSTVVNAAATFTP